MIIVITVSDDRKQTALPGSLRRRLDVAAAFTVTSASMLAVYAIVNASYALLALASVLFAAFVVYALSGYAVSSWLALRRSRAGTQA